MARAVGVGTDRPPVWGARSSASCCRLDGSGSCSTCGGSDWPRSCFIQRGAFATASPPPASPCGDTDGTKSRSAETHPRTLHTRFGSLAQGLVDGPRVTRLGGYDGEVIRDGSTSAAVRRRASARASPPLLRLARSSQRHHHRCHRRAVLLLPAGDTQGIPSESDR